MTNVIGAYRSVIYNLKIFILHMIVKVISVIIPFMVISISTNNRYLFDNNSVLSSSALGSLCERSGSSLFPSYQEMLGCLITADCSDEVLSDGLISCFKSFNRSNFLDIKEALTFLEVILGIIDDEKVLRIALHSACMYVEGEICVAVLLLLLTKYGEKAMAMLRVRNEDGKMPIHIAAEIASLSALQFLAEACPESLYEVIEGDEVIEGEVNLLHVALSVDHYRPLVDAKVQFLCERCPDLLHMRVDNIGTPFQYFALSDKLNLDTMKILCKADETIVMSQNFILNNENDSDNDESDDDDLIQMLPLNLLCHRHLLDSEESDASSCFCYNAVRKDTNSFYTNNYYETEHKPDFIMRWLLNADRLTTRSQLQGEKRGDVSSF